MCGPVLPVFPEQSRECLILIFSLNSCQGGCSSVTAVANVLFLVELGGEQHSLFYNPFPFGLNFNQVLGGIS